MQWPIQRRIRLATDCVFCLGHVLLNAIAIDRRRLDAAHMVMAAGAPVKSNGDDVEAWRGGAGGSRRGPVVSVIPTLW